MRDIGWIEDRRRMVEGSPKDPRRIPEGWSKEERTTNERRSSYFGANWKNGTLGNHVAKAAALTGHFAAVVGNRLSLIARLTPQELQRNLQCLAR